MKENFVRVMLRNSGLVLALFLIINSLIYSCMYSRVMVREELHKYGVVIIDSSQSKVQFILSTDSQRWNKFSLESGEQDLFEVNSSGECFIKILTISKELNQLLTKGYMLNIGKIYQIYWNTNEQVWDIGEKKRENNL
ncbi:MAG: hypothetical protein DKINENOH_05383 [bacterium]|nr:hypothetical protein [bacterium]